MSHRSCDFAFLVAAAAAAGLWILSRARSRPAASSRSDVVDCGQRRAQQQLPRELLCQHYFDLDAAAARGCAHAHYLRTSHDVLTALGARPPATPAAAPRRISPAFERVAAGIHAYVLERLDQEAAALRQHDQAPAPAASDGARPTCIGHVERLLVAPAVFAPERLIGRLDDAAAGGDELPRPLVMVAPGARVLGGTLDASAGPIFIGAGAPMAVDPPSATHLRSAPRAHPTRLIA